MSTNIVKVKGRIESYNTPQPKYEDANISITRFYGGSENGRMIQLTINNSEGLSYIQLTKEKVKELEKILHNCFDDKLYPSE